MTKTKKKIKKKIKRTTNTSRKIARLTAERNEARQEIAQLTAELNTMRKENFRLWTHLEEATSDRDTNNEAYEARTEQVNRLKRALDEARAAIKKEDGK